MGLTRADFRLPADLVENADVTARVTHKNRMDIIKEALQAYLDEVEDDAAFKEAVTELYLDGQIGFEELTAFVGRQDAESVRTSKQILDQGEELADELADL